MVSNGSIRARIDRALDRVRPRVVTLATRARLARDMEDRFGGPYGSWVDLVLEELEAAGIIRIEPGYWGGVTPAPRARPRTALDDRRSRSVEERHAQLRHAVQGVVLDVQCTPRPTLAEVRETLNTALNEAAR